MAAPSPYCPITVLCIPVGPVSYGRTIDRYTVTGYEPQVEGATFLSFPKASLVVTYAKDIGNSNEYWEVEVST